MVTLGDRHQTDAVHGSAQWSIQISVQVAGRIGGRHERGLAISGKRHDRQRSADLRPGPRGPRSPPVTARPDPKPGIYLTVTCTVQWVIMQARASGCRSGRLPDLPLTVMTRHN
jgi:hypothetical protein